MNRYYLFITTVLLCFCFSGKAGEKITPRLRHCMTQTEKIPVIVRLKEQYPGILPLRHYPGSLRNERKTVYRSMQSFCRERQKTVINGLMQKGIDLSHENLRTFWIANVMTLKTTPDIIKELEMSEEVEQIDTDTSTALYYREFQAAPADNIRIADHIKMVRAPEANSYGYTGKGIVVGLIDTGVNYLHEDIADAMWTSDAYPLHGWDFADGDSDPKDNYGHGTHCAGIIAGHNTNGGLRTGVAPDARIMALKVMDTQEKSLQQYVWEAIEFALENGADVMNLSMGWNHNLDPDKKTWRDIMKNLQECGVLFVTAAGNEGNKLGLYPTPYNVRTPADCPAAWLNPEQPGRGETSAVLTIGSIETDGSTPASSSSTGPTTWQDVPDYNDYRLQRNEGLIKPDICAPGTQIYSLNYQDNQTYVMMSGTSMASPCVAGIVALMLSKNPALTPEEIVRCLSETAIPLAEGFQNKTGAGRADALLATLYAPNPDVNCTGLTFRKTQGRNNDYLNPGDRATITLRYENAGNTDITDYRIEVLSLNSHVTVTPENSSCAPIRAGSTTLIEESFSMTVSPEATEKDRIELAVILKKDNRQWTNLLLKPVSRSRLSCDEPVITEISGNNNGLPDAGETIALNFHLSSEGNEPNENVTARLKADWLYVTPLTETELVAGHIHSSTSLTYRLKINDTTPDFKRIPLTLQLQGDNTDTTFVFHLDVGKLGILVVDRSRDHRSAELFYSLLPSKGISWDRVSELPANLDRIHSVWLFAGSAPRNTKLQESEKNTLVSYLNEGGYVYAEGGSLWHTTTPASLNDYFHIRIISNDGGKPNEMTGCHELFTLSDTIPYRFTHDSNDKIEPVEPAFAVYKNRDPEYIAMIACEEESYRTIGSSVEIGGMIDPDSDNLFIDRLFTFFDMTTTPEESALPSLESDHFSMYCHTHQGQGSATFYLSLPGKVLIEVSGLSGQKLYRQEYNLPAGANNLLFPLYERHGIYLVTISGPKGTTTKKLIF